MNITATLPISAVDAMNRVSSSAFCLRESFILIFLCKNISSDEIATVCLLERFGDRLEIECEYFALQSECTSYPIPYRFNTSIVTPIGFIVNLFTGFSIDGGSSQVPQSIHIDLYTLDNPYHYGTLT